jgi:hypothetical protein
MRRLHLIGLMLATLTSAFGADNGLTKQEKTQGWILLFDGKTLSGWDSAVTSNPGQGRGPGSNLRACSTPAGLASVPTGASHWEVVGGLLVPCGGPAGYLTSKETYKDFVLDVDFKTGEDTNSGVFIRAPGGTGGYEVQIWKSQPQGYNTGSIVGTAKTEGTFKFIPDQWNHYEITAEGDHMVVVLNGTKTLDVHDSKFPDGRIRLQYQKYPIEFKNIKLKMIKN